MLDKNYKHKIVRLVRVDTFNKPQHSDITYTCKIFKSLDAPNLLPFYLPHFVFICIFPHLTISISTASFW